MWLLQKFLVRLSQKYNKLGHSGFWNSKDLKINLYDLYDKVKLQREWKVNEQWKLSVPGKISFQLSF